MKRFLKTFILLIACFSISLMTVLAVQPRWTVGTNFTYKGQDEVRNVTRSSNFYMGITILGKYTEGEMTIQFYPYNNDSALWSFTAAKHNVSIESVGDPLNVETFKREYSVSKSSNFDLHWVQKTTGHLAANLYY